MLILKAALAPVVLDLARSRNEPNPKLVEEGIVILTIAVLSILITAPAGAFLIRILTPVLLTKEEEKRPSERSGVASGDES